jgi:hypothetical protein
MEGKKIKRKTAIAATNCVSATSPQRVRSQLANEESTGRAAGVRSGETMLSELYRAGVLLYVFVEVGPPACPP